MVCKMALARISLMHTESLDNDIEEARSQRWCSLKKINPVSQCQNGSIVQKYIGLQSNNYLHWLVSLKG